MTTLRSPETLERADVELRAPRAAAPARDPWFDNVKMALVALVVAGHAWALLPSTPANHFAYNFLYSWHMPAFAIVTGYLSRSFTWTPQRLWSLVRTVAVPYAIFEFALTHYRAELSDGSINNLFTEPHWVMWFLAALFFWRLSVPVFRALPRPAAIALALAISVGSMYVTTDLLDLRRVLGFLPFFVLGLVSRTEDWDRLRAASSRRWAVAGLAGIAVLAWFTDSWISTEWYFYSQTHDVLRVDGVGGTATRLAVISIGLVASVCVFTLVPRGRSWFTALGSATLIVYLFHGFVLLPFKYSGFPAWGAAHFWIAFPLATVAALGVALALASPPVANRLNRLVDPLALLERPRTAAPTSA